MLIFGKKEPCRRFTAIGVVGPREPYTFAMFETFVPFRRDVTFVRSAREAAIAPLVARLSFLTNKAKWGFPFMRGLFEVPAADFQEIASSMGVCLADHDALGDPVGVAEAAGGLGDAHAPASGGKRLRECPPCHALSTL